MKIKVHIVQILPTLIRVSPISTKSLDIPFCIRQTVDVAVIALIDSIFVTAEAASHTTLN